MHHHELLTRCHSGIRRQDTQLIVTEIQKVHVSTQHLHIASSASNGNAGLTTSTATTSSSTSLQVATAQQSLSLPSSAKAGAGDDEDGFETVIVSPAARRRRQARATATTYRLSLPLWITNRAWELNVSTSQNRWTTSLRTYNIIPDDSLVFYLCEDGDLQGVKALFESGRASPFDVDPKGRTLLFVRIYV